MSERPWRRLRAHPLCPECSQLVRCGAERRRGVDHIVDDDAIAPRDMPNEVGLCVIRFAAAVALHVRGAHPMLASVAWDDHGQRSTQARRLETLTKHLGAAATTAPTMGRTSHVSIEREHWRAGVERVRVGMRAARAKRGRRGEWSRPLRAAESAPWHALRRLRRVRRWRCFAAGV